MMRMIKNRSVHRLGGTPMVLFEDDDDDVNRGIAVVAPESKSRGIQDRYYTIILACTLFGLVMLQRHGIIRNNNEASVRHPLAVRQSTGTRTTPHKHDGGIRYLSFGSYDTWGLGLDDYHQAYPYLLSPDVHNVAVQTGGPSIGAVCAQTMIGGTDETHGPYHVILLDFVRFAKQGLLVLAKRLRQRYPQAIILLLQRWTPQHIVDNGNNNSTVTASEWAQANHIAIGSESFLEEWNKTNATLWSFAGLQNRVVLDTASAVEGHILQFPPDHGSNAKTALAESAPFFQPHPPHGLTQRGHQALTKLIRHKVHDTLPPVTTHHPNDNAQAMGTWGSGDDCHMWYATGQVDSSFIIGSQGVRMVTLGSQKHAMEFPNKGGTIGIRNPFEYPRMLYLTYLVSSPPTKVYLGDETSNPATILEPVQSNNSSPRTVAVGLVSSGFTQVRLEPMQPKRNKFRLTGASFLGSTEVPFEYTLEPEAADISG